MKNKLGKKAALLMVWVMILTPILWNRGESMALAATPTFRETSVEIIGEDETYQLDIKDKVAGSTYKWSSTNTKVARVSSKGLVTSVGKGSATIRCIITYPNNKTKTIKSKVTVVIPATRIKINNAKEVNGAHILQLGESYNFNRDIFPKNSSDKTFWSIAGGDKDVIQVVNSSNGIVKAMKPGKVIYMATAARTATADAAAKSIVNDAIIIEVVGPSATVGSVEITDSTVIKAVFNSPVDEGTVIGQNNTLLDSITLSLKKNIKGVIAADPGNLKAELSSDKKTLTITSSNRFEGEYGINFTNKIKTADGIVFDDYYKHLAYVDNVAPDIAEIKLDDSGMVTTIVFTEAVDLSGFNVTGGSVLPGTSTTPAGPVTISIINNKNNYIQSEDKRSVMINLSNIAYTDFNKMLTVTFSGIKDMSGNLPANYTLPVVLRTDNTPKPQAKLINIARTAYDTLTATFDRSIEFGGYAIISNGANMPGKVDEKDLKKVHYTMVETDAIKTGVQNVSISSWRSYNVNPSDTTSYQPHTRAINFNVDSTSPTLVNSEFDPQTNILTLTYNKDVDLLSNTGIFNATLVTVSDEIRPNNNITYTKIASENPKVIKLQIGNMTLIGNYTFTMDQYFVRDSFRNYGIARSITISNSSGTNLELPGPYLVSQSADNPSQIFLEFANRLDVASAMDVRNYVIPGVTVINAKVDKNTNNEGATVVLTIADGSIDITLERPLKISGITSYSGTYAPITDYETTILLKDNKKPYFIEPVVFDKNKLNEIRLNFSEEIRGSMVVKVTELGSYSYEIANNVTIEGSSVTITLNSTPSRNAFLRIEILDNKIVDLSGNQSAPMSTQMGVVAAY